MKNLTILYVFCILFSACSREEVQLKNESVHEEEIPVADSGTISIPESDTEANTGTKNKPMLPISINTEEQKHAGKLLKEIYAHAQALSLVESQKIGFLPCVMLISQQYNSEDMSLVEKLNACLKMGEVLNQSFYEEYPSRKLLSLFQEESWSSALISNLNTLEEEESEYTIKIISAFEELKEQAQNNDLDDKNSLEKYKKVLEETATFVFSSLFTNALYKKTSKTFQEQFIPLIFNYKKIVLPKNREPYAKPSHYSKELMLEADDILNEIYKIHFLEIDKDKYNLFNYIESIKLSSLEKEIYDRITFISDSGASILKNAYFSLHEIIHSNKKSYSILWIEKYSRIIHELEHIKKTKNVTIYHFKSILEDLTELHRVRKKLSNLSRRRTKNDILYIMDEIYQEALSLKTKENSILNFLKKQNEDLLSESEIKEIKKYFSKIESKRTIFSLTRNLSVEKFQKEKENCLSRSFTNTSHRERCLDIFMKYATLSYTDKSHIKNTSLYPIEELLYLPKEEKLLLLISLMEDILGTTYIYPNTYLWNDSVRAMLKSSLFQNLPMDLYSLEKLALDADKIEETLSKIFSRENMDRIISIHKTNLDTIYQMFHEKVQAISEEYMNVNIFKEIPRENMYSLAIELGAKAEKRYTREILHYPSGVPYEPRPGVIPEYFIVSMSLEEGLFEAERKIFILKRTALSAKLKDPYEVCIGWSCFRYKRVVHNLKLAPVYRLKLDKAKEIPLNMENEYEKISSYIQEKLAQKKLDLKNNFQKEIKETMQDFLRKVQLVFLLMFDFSNKNSTKLRFDTIYKEDISSYLIKSVIDAYEKQETRELFPWEEEIYSIPFLLEKEELRYQSSVAKAVKFLYRVQLEEREKDSEKTTENL